MGSNPVRALSLVRRDIFCRSTSPLSPHSKLYSRHCTEVLYGMRLRGPFKLLEGVCLPHHEALQWTWGWDAQMLCIFKARKLGIWYCVAWEPRKEHDVVNFVRRRAKAKWERHTTFPKFKDKTVRNGDDVQCNGVFQAEHHSGFSLVRFIPKNYDVLMDQIRLRVWTSIVLVWIENPLGWRYCQLPSAPVGVL